MSCPTCDHTMETVANGITPATNVHWCPRCGTLRCGDDKRDWNYHLPKLVERCRQFEKAFVPQLHSPAWVSLGIAESIRVSAERSKP